MELTVCSFFSGGGLLDMAFRQYFKIIWANEINPAAAACYRYNVGSHIVVDDIENIAIEQIPFADVFVGGPPCQEFSLAGTNRGETGTKGRLVWRYEEIVRAKRPKAFIMENVTGLAGKHKHTLQRLISSYKEIGYNVVVEKKMDSSLFGTPQKRERVFIVGIRKDIGVSFVFPKGTEPIKTVRQAIEDLPAPDSIGARERVLGTVPNHTATWTNPTPSRIADLLINPRPNQQVGLRRLDWDKPSHTITAHIAKDGREYIHPAEERRLTVRECLRLMGMPDFFVVPAEISLSEQYSLVGNGVSYQIGLALACSLYEQLQAPKPPRFEQMSIFDLIS